jgi:TolA-binding protein
MKFLSLLLLLALSISCIKTADQVNREKRLESISEQMQDSQGLVADMVSQLKDMQAQLDKLNGRIEEIEHKNKSMDSESFNKMSETLKVISTQQTNQNTQMLQLQNELKEQRSFIEKVTSQLSSTAKPSPKDQKKSAKNKLEHGLELIKKDDFSDARLELEELIDHKDLTPGERNKVLHGLGKVEYFTKNFEKSLVYFSKIYSKFPKASLAPSSLLFIARNLKKMEKNDEAKQAYAKVIEDYKASPEASEAKKEM